MKTRYSVLFIIAIFSFFSTSAQVTLPLHQLDTTLLVGATPGNANVSGGGAATYSVPIFVSPGTAGLQPNISIEYNSQVTNGILGAGWNIAGLSAITRAPMDFYHDDKINGVDLQSDDKFEWDGNRLSAIIGSYGGNGTTYATEAESFANIVSANLGSSGTGPESFTITTKEGIVLTYGATSNSRIEASDSPTVLLWRLSQMKDINGNYINYSYTELNGESYIDTISYTGNNESGLLPYNKIKFTYENRPDTSMYYVGGVSISQTKRLIGIDIISETQPVRHYTFSYLAIDTDNAFYEKSRLAQIQESQTVNGITKALNPTAINWGTDTQTTSVISISTSTSTEKTQSYLSDLNGDGRTDQFILGKTIGSTYYTHWYYYQSDGNTLTKIASGNIDLPFCNGAWIADLNNDGKNDLLLKTGTGFIGDIDNYAGYYSIINDSLVRGNIDNDVFLPDENAQIIPGNFNSDGKTDLIILDYNHNYYASKGFTVNTSPVFNTPDKVEKMDFDGDGLDEIFVFKAETYSIYKYNESTLSFAQLKTGTLTGIDAINVKTGDFNGDGKTDIVTRGGGLFTKFTVYLSTGTTFSSPRITLKDPVIDGLDSGNTETDFYILDLNGDGRDDVLNFYSVFNPNPLQTAPVSMQISLITSPITSVIVVSGSPAFVKYYSKFDGTLGLIEYQKIDDLLTGIDVSVDFGDIDGDGIKDATLMVNPFKLPATSGFNGIIYKNYANVQLYQVQTISNGLNHAVGFTYISLAAANSTKYAKGKSSAFPLVDIQPAQFVVSTLTTHAGYMNAGNYVYSVTDFSYKGARSHLQGKGYLGFDTLVSVNSLSNIKTESCYGINSIYFFRYPLALNNYVAGVAANKKTFTFTTVSKGYKRYYSYPLKDVSYDLVTNTTVTHDYTFDSYGNMLTDKATYGSDAVVTTTNTYILKGGSGVPNRLNSSTVSTIYTGSEYAGQLAFATKKSFTYDTKGNCTSVIDFADQAKPVTTTYSLHPQYGLPVSITVLAAGMTSRTSRTDYDTKYRLPIRTINPLGYKSSRTFDFKTGVVLKDSTANGLSIIYGYDHFGRLESTLMPQGYTITQNLAWPKTGNPAGTIYSSTVVTPGKPTVKAYYDILGRAIRSESTGFANKTVYTDVNYVPAYPYGKAGLLTSQSLPYYTGETPLPVKYTYDAYGRVTEVNDRAMTNKSIYSGKTVTATDIANNTSTKTVNALGNITKATDNGGEIVYLYHSSGQPRQITAAGAVTTITYDAYGRQITLADPDAGTTRYTYNSFGELASQTDANGNTDTLVYDVMGRVTQKTLKSASGSEVTNYVYNATGSGIGQLASVTGANGAKQEFTYDAYGRTTSMMQTIPGQIAKFTTSYTYDIYGNNTKITYPETGFAVNNTFDRGTLVKVNRADNNYLIWQIYDISSHGMPLRTVFGNGLFTNYTYDMDQLTQIVTDGGMQNETYTVNHPNIGNVMYRKDNSTGQYENFTYDNLDRLTSIKYLTDTAQIITYSGNGNITSKYNGGTYAYDPTKVHAVTSVTKTHGTVSQALQDITYTRFNKADLITQKTPVTQKTLTYALTYGPDEQRVKSIYTDTLNAVTTRYYAGSYEKEIKGYASRKIHYITGGTGLVAVYIKWGTGQDSLYYVCTDRQGSITALFTQDRKVRERYSYDAYGRRRNPANWTDYNVKAPRIISRGYTGHEHLDGFGLINMNGRIYDPVIGRVLSPDKVVQAPGYTQSYNRYSYCMNNPLRYTDPSGWYVATGTDFGRDIIDMSNRGVTFYSYGIGSPGNYFSGTGVTNTSLGAQGYRYVGGGVYLDVATGHAVDYSTVHDNYILPNAAQLPANTIINSIEIGEKGVWFQYSGNGPVYTSALTAPGAENPHYETSGGEVIAKFIPWGNFGQSEGINWKGVTNATILLAGGLAEMAIGGASEYFSLGISSSVSIPLIVDGGVRTATNAQRLWQYLNGKTQIANSYPTSIGSLAGKGIDMTFGVSPYSVGYGQAIGSWGNDLISFGATGGTGGALLEIQRTQNVDAYLNYLFTYLSYPYSQYHNKPNK